MDRVALVTGGAGVLGWACVEELLDRGARVAIVDRELPAGIAAYPADRVCFVDGDITSPVDVARALDRVVAHLGVVTILVNAAGIARPTRFVDISLDEWHEVIDASVAGTFLMTQACVSGMRAAGWGRIVNFSSTAGKNVSTLAGAHYTTAKAGILGLTRALAKELGGYGITVNSVCPGIFETTMARTLATDLDLDAYVKTLPIPRIGDPHEVGKLVGFLSSDEAGYITGASIDINGGELMV